MTRHRGMTDEPGLESTMNLTKDAKELNILKKKDITIIPIINRLRQRLPIHCLLAASANRSGCRFDEPKRLASPKGKHLKTVPQKNAMAP